LVRLGDVVDLTTGFPFASQQYTDDPTAPRLLRGDNVGQGAIRWDGAKRWPAPAAEGLDAYWLREGDVILAMDRPWIEAGLKYAYVRESDLPALLVQRVARLRGSDRLDTGYLRYVIAGRGFTDYVTGIQTGTAVPHISGGQIQGYRFPLPPLAQQRRIAGILGALDDKIELNRRMSQTLESMARALFKSWFVDFDPVHAKAEGRDCALPIDLIRLFPDSFEVSEVGEIPSGWQVCGLDKIAEFLNGLALQRFPANDGRALPVIKIAQLHAGNTDGADEASADIPGDYVVEDGDVLFSWSGSLSVELWCGGPGALNQHLFKVTSGLFPKWFYYQWTRQHLSDFSEIAAGKATTMGHIQRGHLRSARVLVPSTDLLGVMTSNLEPLLSATVNARLQARTLARIRDGLLPRLLAGQTPQ
jgi:type I restriction enzyme S subunit